VSKQHSLFSLVNEAWKEPQPVDAERSRLALRSHGLWLRLRRGLRARGGLRRLRPGARERCVERRACGGSSCANRALSGRVPGGALSSAGAPSSCACAAAAAAAEAKESTTAA
jgi:hypothetical protein